jgi:hypothetical protein
MKITLLMIACVLMIGASADASLLVAYKMDGNLSEVAATGAQNNVLSARDTSDVVVAPNGNAFVAGVPGLGGQALQLRTGGSNVAWADTPDASDPDLGGLPSATDWTVELFFRPKLLPGENSFARLALHWTLGNSYHLSIRDKIGSTGPRLDLFTTYTSSGEQTVNGITELALDKWYYAAAVKSGNTVSLYLNGALEGSYAVVGDMVNDSTPLFFGSYNTQFPFTGYLDDIRIWNEAVTPDYLSARAALVPEPHTGVLAVAAFGIFRWRRQPIRGKV